MSSADFEPERYADEYRERALAMIEKKVEGQEIKAVAPGAAAHKPGRRHLCGIKAELGNCRPAESDHGTSQAKKEGVGADVSESLDILFRLHAFARAANPFLFRLRMNFYLCQSVH
jgi:hypothetical protein